MAAQPNSSTTLGDDREVFLHTVLSRSLPASIRTDRGVIVYSNAPPSNPQDILLYRSDFPILANVIGSRRFLAEGVVAAIEVKSNVDEKEFKRAINTLKTIHSMRSYEVSCSASMNADDKSRAETMVKNSAYAMNQMSPRGYLFSYRGVQIDSILRYIGDLFKEKITFWQLPSVICILEQGICLIRDDGQLLPPDQKKSGSQVIYRRVKDSKGSLELFMIHVLSSCYMASPSAVVPGTPLRFNIYNYAERSIQMDGACMEVNEDLSQFKIPWYGGKHVTTNDLLQKDGFVFAGERLNDRNT